MPVPMLNMAKWAGCEFENGLRLRMGNARARQLQMKRKLDAALDQALVQTFPASDPTAVGHPTATEPASQPLDRKPPLIDRGAIAAAQRRVRRGRAAA